MHFNKHICKSLRTINKETKVDKLSISSNLFGFTAIILRRLVRLTALSREFIVTYELQQKDFDELVAQYPADFEAVCQLRDNIHNTDIPESYEGPELLDPRMHFVPTKGFIVRKYLKNYSQRRKPTNRSSFSCRYGKFSYTQEPEKHEGSDHIIGIVSRAEELSLNPSLLNSIRYVVSKEDNIGVVVSDNIAKDFEQVKSYNKYFVGSNIERVLNRFNPKALSTRNTKLSTKVKSKKQEISEFRATFSERVI